MIDDMRRIRSAQETIQAKLYGSRESSVLWNLGWRDAFRLIRVSDVLKSCKSIEFDGSDGENREAKVVARMIRRGHAFVKQVEEVERDLADLYPADVARRRLDDELGWEHHPSDSIQRKLDRSCMLARVHAPPFSELRARAHGIVRSRFSDLEFSEDAA